MNKFLISILTSAAMFTSCADLILDLEPLDQVTDVTFFSTEKELQLALNSTYGLMNFASAEQILLTQYMESILTDNCVFRITDEHYGLQALSNSVHTSNSGFQGIYSELYKGIGRANNILQNMHRAKDIMDESAYNDVKAQALTLRAYFYDYLTLMFGDVPFLEILPTSIEEGLVQQTPKDEIVNKLFKDLDDAATLIKKGLKGGQERITEVTIYALKARIALNNKLYDIAAEASAKSLELANSYGVTLYPDYKNLFTLEGENASEILLKAPCDEAWGRPNYYPLRMGDRFGFFAQLLPTQNMVDAYPTINGLPIDKDPTYNPKKPWENRDPRMRASIVFPQDIWGGRVFESHRDSLTTLDANGKRVANNNSRSVAWPAGLTGYLWKKSVDSLSIVKGITTAYNDMILMRLGEVYLIKAEAEIERNGDLQSAADAINSLRRRAWKSDAYPKVVVSSQDEMRKILRMERRIELAMEGFRYYDLIRWNIIENARKEPLVGRVMDLENASYVPTIDNDGIVHYNDRSEYDDWKSLNINGEIIPDGYESRLYGNWANAVERNFTSPRDYLFPIPLREIELYESYGYKLVQNEGY